MIRRPPRSTQGVSSAASDVYKRQHTHTWHLTGVLPKYRGLSLSRLSSGGRWGRRWVHAREEQREHDFSECDARAEMGSLSLRLVGSLSSCSPVSRHLISAEIHRLMLRLMISETSRDGQDRFAKVRPTLLAVESPPRGTREARPLGVLHTRFAVQTRASR